MMAAFRAAMDRMFRDPHMSVAATHRAGGAGDGTPVRVIKRAPDRLASFGDGRFVAESVLIDVRISEVSDLEPGDTFEIGATIYEVRGEPVRDSQRLTWAAEARAL